MMFIILDRDPVIAVDLLVSKMPKQFYSKQLIELGQLVSSAGLSTVYSSLGNKGKEIQDWIKGHTEFTAAYYHKLFEYCTSIANINYKPETIDKFNAIMHDLNKAIQPFSYYADSAVFRYSQAYTDTEYRSNTELLIFTATEEYTKYLDWKLNYFRTVLKWKV